MINRREFMMIAAGGLLSAMSMDKGVFASENKKTKLSLIKTSDRQSGIKRAIELLNINPVKDKNVLLKPNFNTADPFPGSTHNDTLINLILHLKKMGAKGITIGERSGPPDTADVLTDKGIYELCKKYVVWLINF
ncbi:MAG: DUF362 domain-containing protein [Nitrospirae bacterium]|nr:DUF362 domain-containing protein [Nitrospirota bacterium]